MPYSLDSSSSEMIGIQLILIMLSPCIKNFWRKFLTIDLRRNFIVLLTSLKWLKSINIPSIQCHTLSVTPNFINDQCKILKFGMTITVKFRVFNHSSERILCSSSLTKFYLVENNLSQEQFSIPIVGVIHIPSIVCDDSDTVVILMC